MSRTTPLVWLLDVETYDFTFGSLKDLTVRGTVLMLSRQLWSLLYEDQLKSALIGPGFFKGVAKRGSVEIAFEHPLGALLFDPTEMRLDEPVPQVNIISPEVIDPFGKVEEKEVIGTIKSIISKRGNVIAYNTLAKVHPQGSIPKIYTVEEFVKKIKVRYISGKVRARFVVAGTNNPVYRGFKESLLSNLYKFTSKIKIMDVAGSKILPINDWDYLNDWTIVELAHTDYGEGKTAFKKEYFEMLDAIYKNQESYLFD